MDILTTNQKFNMSRNEYTNSLMINSVLDDEIQTPTPVSPAECRLDFDCLSKGPQHGTSREALPACVHPCNRALLSLERQAKLNRLPKRARNFFQPASASAVKGPLGLVPNLHS